MSKTFLHLLAATFALTAGQVSWAAEAGSNWTDKVKVGGDFRYRHETIDKDGSKKINQHRIRARLALDGKVNDEVTTKFQLSTGGTNPVSGNENLGGSFSKKTFNLDLAYFQYTPENLSGLSLTGGKQKNPLYMPAKSELVWDSDLNPEGLGLNYTRGFNNGSFSFVTAMYWVETNDDSKETYLFPFQLNGSFDLTEKFSIGLGTGYYAYTNVQDQALSVAPKGNTAVGNAPSEAFRLWEAYVLFGIKAIDKLPIGIVFDYVSNMAAEEDKKGWLAGFTLGQLKDPHSFAFRYNYRKVETNAVLGSFTDSDFKGGGTNGKGHEFGLDYQLAGNTELGLTYFLNATDVEGDTDYKRFQADISFKF